MHRRGIVLLVGFLVAVVVAGGGGVSVPWLPSDAEQQAQVGPVPAVPRTATRTVGTPVRVE